MDLANFFKKQITLKYGTRN